MVLNKRLFRIIFFFVLFLGFALFSQVSASTSTAVVATSSSANATGPSTMRNIISTSDGTIHSFVQVGTQSATCGGVSKSGLLWFTSSDLGSTWTCQGQLSSDTVNLMDASATVDASDNIYVSYSTISNTGSTSYDVFYRRLTKNGGANWTVENAQTVFDSTAAGTGYSYATIIAEDGTRLWMAARYYDGTNYQVRVVYSDSQGIAPTWSSQVGIDTATTSNTRHGPILVRFSTHIGVIYNNDASPAGTKWKFRSDSDALTVWSNEQVISTGLNFNTYSYTAVGDSSGNIFFSGNLGGTTMITFYYNGTLWLSGSSYTASGSFAGISTDNYNVWLTGGDSTGLSSGLSGSQEVQFLKSIYIKLFDGFFSYMWLEINIDEEKIICKNYFEV